ncbi:Abi family protein [Jeotgalibacillus sp. JSM ZJ347]|uniref:Abi family protein n=1 Tax=Jeotgalibacillus sp. JSM ZJ347 TaxID=3342117 RepID=UPI0035A97981
MKRICREGPFHREQSSVSYTSEVKDEIAATVIKEEVDEKSNYKNNLNDKAINKENLTVYEQINYLKLKGITFDQIDERIAGDILSNRTYYYKVTAFRKNFKKDNGQYKNVDFGLLNDLATIDMHFRYLFLKLSLDIEHNIKTLLINLITESDEDGYKIVEEYKAFEVESYRKRLIKSKSKDSLETIDMKVRKYETIDKKLMDSFKSPRDYSYDLISKRKSKPSIWVLIELMSYGQLSFFINFYVQRKKYKYKELNLARSLLLDSKNIRDSAAHSRPIIFNIVGPNEFLLPIDKRPKLQVRNYLTQECNLPDKLVNGKIKNLKIHDVSALLYLHDHYVNGKITRRERKKELVSLMERCRLKKQYYENHSDFSEVYYLILKIIKNYSVKK